MATPGDPRVVTAQDQVITPAGRQVTFAGRPSAVALDPKRDFATLSNSNGTGLVRVDLATGTVAQSVSAGNNGRSHTGIAYNPSGTLLVQSLDEGDLAFVPVNTDGSLGAPSVVALPVTSVASAPDPIPGGLTFSADGSTLYVALQGQNALAVVNVATKTVTATIPVGVAPYDVVLSADGKSAYVSNEGGRPAGTGDANTDLSYGTPVVIGSPTALGGSASRTGTVSVVNLASAAQTLTIPTGLQPTAELVSPDGKTLYVADTNSDQITEIDTATDTVANTIAVTPFPQAPNGSSPDALAMLPDGRLAVALGRNNAIALYAPGTAATTPAAFLGLLPTASNPLDVVYDATDAQFVVANDKGIGNRGGTVTDPKGTGKGYNTLNDFVGSVSLVPTPTPTDLATDTSQVSANNGWNGIDETCANTAAAPKAIPAHIGDPSKITHVFYITKENRTYDQVLGDDSRGNGDPTETDFGATVTPNQHAIVKQYPLLDNFYDMGQLSADGHNWFDQGDVPSYTERQFSDFTRSYPASGLDALAYLPTGFIWEDATTHGKTVKDYGEYANIDTSGGTTTAQTTTDVPSLQPLLDPKYPGFATQIPDQTRMSYYLSQLASQEATNTVPNLTLMTIPDDHTGTGTPAEEVQDNDTAVGELVQALSTDTALWDTTAVFIAEDDAQNGTDHVDGHRTTAYIASPYAKPGVDHTYYTQVNMLRTVEQILGLPPMNQMDDAAQPMRDAFTDTPDNSAPFTLKSGTPVDGVAPAVPGSPAAATRSAWLGAQKQFDLSGPDRVEPGVLARFDWYATKGWTSVYPGDTTVLQPAQVASGRINLPLTKIAADPDDGYGSQATVADLQHARVTQVRASVTTKPAALTVQGYQCTAASAGASLPDASHPVDLLIAGLAAAAPFGVLVMRRRRRLRTT